MDKMRIFNVIFLGLAPSVNDQVSDVLSGVNFLTPYKVNFNDSDENIPSHCFKVDNSTLSCTDRVWGILALSFTQMPGVISALLHVLVFKDLWLCLFYLFFPYPLYVWYKHIKSLFGEYDSETETELANFVFLEAGFEASPQLLLQMYITLRQIERDVSVIQWITILTSSLTIIKGTMEGYATDDNEKDSMLFGRGVCEKINILAKISPAFITSLLFRVRLKFDKNNSLLIISCTLGWFSHHFVHHPARLHSSLCKLWYPLHFWNAQVYVWRLGYCFLLLSDKCTCSDCSYQ